MSNFNQDVAERALKRHCDAINKILETVKIAYPDACMFLDGTGHLNLLSTSNSARFDHYLTLTQNKEYIMKTQTIDQLKERHAIELIELRKEIDFNEANIGTNVRYVNIANKKDNDYVSFTAANKKDIADIIRIYPPTEKTAQIKLAGKEPLTVKSPYIVCSESTINKKDLSAQIAYRHNQVEIWIAFPQNLISSYLREYKRAVTSSEYHYFTGKSNSEIKTYTVSAWSFGNDITVQFYDGSNSCKSADVNNSIVDSLIK